MCYSVVHDRKWLLIDTVDKKIDLRYILLVTNPQNRIYKKKKFLQSTSFPEYIIIKQFSEKRHEHAESGDDTT